VLIFVGAKMLLTDILHLPPVLSLMAIVGILAAAVVASLLADRRDGQPDPTGAGAA